MPKDDEGHLRLAEEIELTDTWKAMERLVQKGLCKAIGMSNYNSKQLTEIMDKCSVAPAILQAECNVRFNNEGLRYELRRRARRMDIELMPIFASSDDSVISTG